METIDNLVCSALRYRFGEHSAHTLEDHQHSHFIHIQDEIRKEFYYMRDQVIRSLMYVLLILKFINHWTHCNSKAANILCS